ncbi:MAG TPA: hypothetical protein PLW86_03115, partial [Rhodocyclaceae bacterium]|nr:hypothetical protein [Rhodocyclaceae bacterium]
LGFTKWVDSGIAPEVRELADIEWDARSERGAEFLEEGFHPLQGGPAFDVLLIRGKGPLRLLFRACHAAVDGRGMLHWVEEVFRALRGEALLGAPATAREIDVMKKFQDKIPESVKRANNDLLPASLPVIPPGPQPSGRQRYVWRCVTVASDGSNAMPKMAVFLANYARRQGDGPVSFTIPVDLRALREPMLSTGNVTGRIHLVVEQDDTARKVMKLIAQKLRDYTDCWIPPVAGIVPWMPMSSVIKEVRKFCARGLYQQTSDLPSACLVSIGATPLEHFSAPGFTARKFIGMPTFVGKMNVVFCNMGKEMAITIGVPEVYNSNGQLDALMSACATHFARPDE